MSEVNAIYTEMVRFYNFKHGQLFDELYNNWRGLTARTRSDVVDHLNNRYIPCDDKANEILSTLISSSSPERDFERLTKSSYREKAMIADAVSTDDPVEDEEKTEEIKVKEFEDTEQEIARKLQQGVNSYLLDRTFWANTHYQLAEKLCNTDDLVLKTLGVRSLLKAIDIISEIFGLGLYSNYSKGINKLHNDRVKAGKKGGGERGEVYKRIRQEACYLLYEYKPRDSKWESKQTAAGDIGSDLWKFITKLKRQFQCIDIEEDNLVDRIIDWSINDNDVRRVFSEVAEQRTTAAKTEKKNKNLIS